jgi:hypothetical protein
VKRRLGGGNVLDTALGGSIPPSHIYFRSLKINQIVGIKSKEFRIDKARRKAGRKSSGGRIIYDLRSVLLNMGIVCA